MSTARRIAVPCLALGFVAVAACSSVPMPATIPSPEPVCLDLSYGRAQRLAESPKQVRISPGTQHGYVDWRSDHDSVRTGEWTHDGGSWLWITLPVGATTLRYVLVTSGSLIRGQVTSDAESPGALPGVADVSGRLRPCR